jgi:D-inositol-3-phosphate glycosyltransferase
LYNEANKIVHLEGVMVVMTQFETNDKLREGSFLDTISFDTVLVPAVSTHVDRFAALRQMGFHQLNGSIPAVQTQQAFIVGLDPLSSLSVLEYDWARAFRAGYPLDLAPLDNVDPSSHSAILRGLNRSGAAFDPALLERQLGVSASSDASIYDAFERLYNDAAPAEDRDHDADGITIAQFMFLGTIGQAGKGDSGGLGVFLSSLGDALASTAGVRQVYTFVLSAGGYESLPEQRGENHTVVPVNLPFEGTLDQYGMMAHEIDLENVIANTLRELDIKPDVFHLRYADHGSLAAMRVAKSMGKKVVFTLTPDPHRTLSKQYDQYFLDNQDMAALDFALQRVYAADRLMEGADGLVVMPNSAGLAPLKAYFPQFELDDAVRSKPLAVLSEGIQLQDPTASIQLERVSELLPPEFLQRPVMLNVGRLHPVKQQHLLVEAWASSGIWKTYNLLLIGGNQETPNAVEADMLTSIGSILDRYPEAQPHFLMLPALDNGTVRMIERALVASFPAELPHIYACSSVKEEFGIAVLEAMDAGLLVIGPERGGLSSYIDHACNGFLMETDTADTIAAGINQALSDWNFSAPDLHDLARFGQDTVRNRFDITQTAQEFAQFYRTVLG